jgi:hypothetical protein
LLPESLLLRKQLEQLDEAVGGLPTEQAVREHVEELNRQIRRARIMPSGPPVMLRLARVEEVLARWRESRPEAQRCAAPARAEAGGRVSRSGWWDRFTGRGPAGS